MVRVEGVDSGSGGAREGGGGGEGVRVRSEGECDGGLEGWND